MFFLATILTLWCLVTPIMTVSYPLYGAKRYHRAQHQNAPSSPSVISHLPQQSYYNHYYEQQQPYYYQQQQQPLHSNYENGYIAQNGFYHTPSHNSRLYGMPTYQGEYIPQPYYYAKAPTYRYYEEKEPPTSNPLDDLQEEIRFEDQQDLQDWYAQRQREAQTNNFLRNLIAYNREVDEEQAEDEGERHNQQVDEYDDYVNGQDYDYDNQQPDYYDIQNYVRDVPQRSEVEDEEVRQLQYLAKHQQAPTPVKSETNHIDDKYDYSQKKPASSPLSSSSSVSSPAQSSPSSLSQYDDDNSMEYDMNDDDWISWERKRSVNVPMKKDESILAFSDRKPSPMTTLKPSVLMQKTATTTTTTKNPNELNLGQKEIAQLRPANARHYFSAPIMDLYDKGLIGRSVNGDDVIEKKPEGETKNNDDIYDTIKHLIAMEKQLENTNADARLQKRFIATEESLVAELDKLKGQRRAM